jgi:hypothetical protein
MRAPIPSAKYATSPFLNDPKSGSLSLISISSTHLKFLTLPDLTPTSQAHRIASLPAYHPKSVALVAAPLPLPIVVSVTHSPAKKPCR